MRRTGFSDIWAAIARFRPIASDSATHPPDINPKSTEAEAISREMIAKLNDGQLACLTLGNRRGIVKNRAGIVQIRPVIVPFRIQIV